MSGGKDWSKDAVLRTIKNRIYAGFMPHGDERYEGEHEAIVDKAQFARVEALLAGMSKHDKKVRPAGQIPAEAIETFVVDRICEASLGGLMSEQVHAELKRRIDQWRERLTKERKNLPARIAKLADEGSRLADKVYGMSDDGARLLEGRIEKVGVQLAKAETRLAEVERGLAAARFTEFDAATATASSWGRPPSLQRQFANPPVWPACSPSPMGSSRPLSSATTATTPTPPGRSV